MQGEKLKAFREAVAARKRELDELDPIPEEPVSTPKLKRRIEEHHAVLLRPEPESKGRIGGIEL